MNPTLVSKVMDATNTRTLHVTRTEYEELVAGCAPTSTDQTGLSHPELWGFHITIEEDA